jgi:hypothetical protein
MFVRKSGEQEENWKTFRKFIISIENAVFLKHFTKKVIFFNIFPFFCVQSLDFLNTIRRRTVLLIFCAMVRLALVLVVSATMSFILVVVVLIFSC